MGPIPGSVGTLPLLVCTDFGLLHWEQLKLNGIGRIKESLMACKHRTILKVLKRLILFLYRTSFLLNKSNVFWRVEMQIKEFLVISDNFLKCRRSIPQVITGMLARTVCLSRLACYHPKKAVAWFCNKYLNCLCFYFHLWLFMNTAVFSWMFVLALVVLNWALRTIKNPEDHLNKWNPNI